MSLEHFHFYLAQYIKNISRSIRKGKIQATVIIMKYGSQITWIMYTHKSLQKQTWSGYENIKINSTKPENIHRNES